MTEQFDIRWEDSGREPKCAPDPAFPHGIDADISAGAAKTCTATLAYPAPRCGTYIIACKTCGLRTGITTAGRPDDPRTVKFGCYSHKIDPNPPGMTKVIFAPQKSASAP